MEEEKSVTVPTDVATVKKWARWLRYAADPEYVFEEASKKLSSPSDSPKTQEEVWSEFAEDGYKLAMAAGVGSQYALAGTVHERYRPFLVSVARQLIEEYGCTKPSEIAMAEMAAAAYVHFIEYSGLMTTFKLDAAVGKERDRTYRQYTSTIGALRQMKSPPVSVNITAKTAFVGQNQVNAINNQTSDENHEAK